MIFNAEPLKKISETYDSLKNELDKVHQSLQTSLTSVDARIAALETTFGVMHVQKAAEYEYVSQHLALITKTREDVEKSTRSFTDVQRKIERVVDEQIGAAITSAIALLKLDSGKYDSAKKEIERSAALLAQMNEELAKFHAISREIKQGDFQLVKYAKELQASDSERVKLMKEIDDLQRMVAKMRRGPEQRKSQMKF